MRAYITLLSTENYLPGVFALHESLKRSGTPHPFVVAVADQISPEIDAIIERTGIIVRRIPPTTAIPKDMIEGNGHWGHTFDKVHLFGMHEFEKLVYVDSDMLVLANMDELFDRPHMSAVPAGRLVHSGWVRLNGGLLVIEPKKGLADGIFATLPQAKKEVAETEAAFHRAVLAADTKTIESLTDESFIWTHRTGEHLRIPEGNLARVHLTLHRAFGLPTTSWGWHGAETSEVLPILT